jgi:type IV fimbrial biogenesis protein FimT
MTRPRVSNSARGLQGGYNLLELLVTMAIAGIVLGVGIPSFTEFLANNRMASAANDLVTSIHVARTEAVKQRRTTTLCASSNWDAANPDCDLGGGTGWIVFVDLDGDVSVDAGDTVVLTHAPLATGVTFTTNADATGYLQFGGNGFPLTAPPGPPITDMQLCDGRGDQGTGQDADGNVIAAGRWITVGVTGRPQLYRTQADVQGNPAGGC